MEQINFQKILDDAENLKPEDGAPIFKFTSVGDRIVAKFVGRRRGIKTQQQENAIVLDVDIQASELIGDQPVTGPYSVFESGHITQIMDRANLKPGDVFVLKLDNVNRKSRFKSLPSRESPRPTVVRSHRISATDRPLTMSRSRRRNFLRSAAGDRFCLLRNLQTMSVIRTRRKFRGSTAWSFRRRSKSEWQ